MGLRATWKPIVYVVAVLLFCVVAAFGCANEDQGTRDAPIDANLQDNAAPLIVNGPNGFHNLALKCAAGDLLVVHTRAAAPVVVKDSSACAPGAAEALGIPRIRGFVPAAQ